MDLALFLFLNYLKYTFVIIIFYFIGFAFKGFLIKNNPEKNNFEEIFSNLLIGITFFVVAFSCYRAGFKTINVGILILSIFFLFEYKKTFQLNNGNKINFYENKSSPLFKYLILIFPLQLLFILISFVVKINWGGDFPFVEQSNDYVHYNAISRSLAETGFENTYMTEKYLEPLKFNFCSEYHYYDLWLNAGISYFTNSNYELTYFFISTPLLALVSTIGLLAIWERFNKITLIHVLFAFVLFHISQIHLPFYNHFYYLNMDNYRLEHFGGTIPGGQELKLLPYYPFVIAAIIKLLDKSYILSSLLFLMLIFVYTSAIPVVLGIIMMTIFWEIYGKKYHTENKSYILSIKICFYTIFALAIYFAFYSIFKGEGVTFRDNNNLELLNPVINKIRINIIALSIFQTIAVNLPIILIIAYYFITYKVEKFEWFILLLITIVFITGLLAWALYCKNVESVQLIGNNFVIIYLFIATLLIDFHSKIKWQKHNLKILKVPNIIDLFTIIILLSCCGRAIYTKFEAKSIFLNQYTDIYKSNVMKICSNTNINPVGAYIKAPKDYTTFSNRLSPTGILSTFLTYIPECYYTINISTFDIPKEGKTELDKEREDKMIQCMFFEGFIKKQKNELMFSNYEKSQLDFINYYKIDYILTSKNAKLSKLITPLVEKKVCDNLSGECFYLLNRKL